MSLLYRVLFAAACKNTHHRLALDALRHLRDPRAETWRTIILQHHDAYLKGSTAPDEQFKDFVNHVLHVRDNYWGGALKTAQLWYKLTLQALKNEDWRDVAYSAGVLSHYFSDPFMPFHSGQTEAEGKIHRAAEWSIAQSYVELQNIIEQDQGGYPLVETNDSPTWLSDLIRQGADDGNAYYDTLLEHYNLALGVKNPPLGLDQELKDCMARQIGRAAAGFAVVLDRLFAESAVEPPIVNPTVKGFIATLSIPAYWVTKKLSDAKDRTIVQAIFDEVQATGKAVATLPEDEKAVRKVHAEQVLHTPLRTLDTQKTPPTGAKHGTGAAPRVRSNKARILGGASLPTMPTVQTPRLRMPKMSVPKISLPKMSLPKLSMPSLNLSKLSMPKMPKLSLPKISLPKRKPKPTETPELVTEAKPVMKTAIDSPPRPRRRTDMDVPHTPPAATGSSAKPQAASSPLLRRTDPPEAAPPQSAESRRAGADAKFHLDVDAPVEDAPSIGSKTAKRLEAIGIRTVGDLLDCSPTQTAKQLNSSFIKPDVIERWQRQAVLMCRVPNLRGHDAQMIIGCGVDDAELLARQSPQELLDDVERFLSTADGEKVLRGGTPPDLDEVNDWIRWSRQARPLQTA